MMPVSRAELKFFRCRRCLYPNTKPDIWFNEEGLCSACIAYDQRKKINWDAKREQFLALIAENRGKPHDVIVACSGGKDSTYQIVKCKELGLNPLAVTATTDHLTPYGRQNLDNIRNLCDHVEITPNLETRKRIARFCLQEVGDISWAEHHAIWSIPAQEALRREIPIVLYGECPQNEYGAGPLGTEGATSLTEEWTHEFGGFLGLRLSDLVDVLGLRESDLDIYRYPSDAIGITALWMGAYFPWDGYENYLVAKAHGFQPYPNGDIEGSLYGYENLDNYQTGLHDRLRFLKFGYSRATDIASNHIRRNRMKREEGELLCRWREMARPDTYLGKPYKEILEHIGMSPFEWVTVCERFTNHELVEWALSPESYQCFSGTEPVAASKEDSSVTLAA